MRNGQEMPLADVKRRAESVKLHLPAIGAHPSTGDELLFIANIDPLHLDLMVLVLAELVFDVH